MDGPATAPLAPTNRDGFALAATDTAADPDGDVDAVATAFNVDAAHAGYALVGVGAGGDAGDVVAVSDVDAGRGGYVDVGGDAGDVVAVSVVGARCAGHRSRARHGHTGRRHDASRAWGQSWRVRRPRPHYRGVDHRHRAGRGGLVLVGVGWDLGDVAAASDVGTGRGFVSASASGELGDVAAASSAGGGSALAGV